MKLVSHKVRKLMKAYYLSKALMVRGPKKSPQKCAFWGFDINLLRSCLLLLLKYRTADGLPSFCKNYIPEKILVLEL